MEISSAKVRKKMCGNLSPESFPFVVDRIIQPRLWGEGGLVPVSFPVDSHLSYLAHVSE